MDSLTIKSSRTQCLLTGKHYHFVESMLITRMENQKTASRISSLEHIYHFFTPITNVQKPYMQRYGQPHSRIIIISETPIQKNLNQDKLSERNKYLIPTTSLRCPSSPEPKFNPTSITSTHLVHQYMCQRKNPNNINQTINGPTNHELEYSYVTHHFMPPIYRSC